MKWSRARKMRPVVRLQLATSEEAFEGILLGRWDGHYQLLNTKLLAPGTDGKDKRYKMDGRVSVPESRVLCFQVLDQVAL